ncbi:efflux RND transporter periplasmic adaptor subunit [Cyclobacterium marinum]|uniref:efflux RND transporter periplasmic adaptor subunit n=1 Tax=Cyclobacterium marinum TaxID=104 RepID=UPI0011EE422E|nr:efflux RND transporter periplasmic adaptor subunit [Cyclobacterium marinum]MBI0398130.1 efflux RND transporter periplasmic adaptor subunit [Cyclobacterium marinum]
MNTNKKIIIIALSTLAIGLLLGWLIFGGSSSESKMDDEHQHTTEIAGETVWTCSMHPQIRQSEPGDCPICGMDLIALEDDQDEVLDPMAVSMSPTAMQLADIRTATVDTMDPVKTVRLNGKVQEDERLVSSQSSHIPGRIERLNVNFTGEYVRRGQVIAYIYSPDLVTAQEELFEAQKIKDTQPQLFKSARAKLKNWKLSDGQVDKILESGTPSDEFPITADISGYVLSKNVNVGDYIKRGEPIYEIANLSRVWVLFDVYESDMPWINKGDQVQYTVQSLPGQTFESKISFLDPVINPKTRVAKARVEVPNKDNQLKPEMFASGTVEATLPKRSNNVIVPKTAVMWTGKRSVVYVKNTSGSGVSFMMRDVTLGPGLGDSFIVESGLEEGEEIAVNGTFSIDAAAQLAGKPSMMNPEGGPAMTGHNHGGMEMLASSSTSTPGKKAEVKSISINQKAKDELKPLYEEYLNFKDALVADNLAEAQSAANELKAKLDAVNMSIFTGVSHNAWMDHSSNLKNALQHVQHLKDIEAVRKAFQQVSEGMIDLTKAFNPLDQTLYVQFCPMADNNKGANWLSTEEEIRNPYFGEAMLTCGEVKSTIK